MNKLNIKVNKTPENYTQQNIVKKKTLKNLANNVIKYTLIPGLKEGAIPQGMCYSQKNNLLIISTYHNGHAPSVLHFINFETGKLIKSILLKNNDNTYYVGHAGGIATNDDILWLVDDYKIYEYDLNHLMSLKNMDFCKAINIYRTDVKADFSTYSNGILWVGEYYYRNIYKTQKSHRYTLPTKETNHGFVFGYKINENNYKNPDYVLSIPNRVQGIAFSESGQIILSQSFWSFQASEISVYDNIIKKESNNNIKINDKNIPLWFLSNSDLLYKLKLPPMSEGIVSINKDIYVLFESASTLYKYYTANKVDHILKLKKD